MQHFRAWLASIMHAKDDGRYATLSTVGEATAMLGVTTDELEQMCGDIPAHGFSVSMEAVTDWWHTDGGRRIELL